MKDSYLSCFHEVDLTEEKWFWNHRREVCVAYAIGYSQLVRGMCDIQLDAWKQWFSFILCVLQTSFSTGRTAALSTSRGVQRVRPWSEEGVLVLLYTPPPALPFPPCCCMALLLLLLSIQKSELSLRDAVSGILPGPVLWARWKKGRNLGKAFFSPMQLHSCSFPSTYAYFM